MAELPRLRVGLSLDSATFVAETQKVQGAVSQMGTGIAKQNQQIQQGFGAVSGAVNTARSALSAFGIGLSIAAVSGFVKSTFAVAEALKAASDTAGVSAEQLQEWRFAASQSGSSAEQMDGALQKLNQRLGDFIIDGTGPAAEAFEELGVATDISSGKLQGTGAVMDAVVAALTKIEDPAKRAAIAAGLFGRDAGPKMAGLLNQGVEAINKLREDTTKLSNEQTARADEIADAWAKMTGEIKTRLQSVTIDLADFAVQGANNQKAVAAGYERMADEVIASTQRMVEGVDEWMGERLDGALAGGQMRVQGVIDAFEFMRKEVVGESIVPDMVREIQGWMERLDGPAMYEPTKRAVDRTTAEFERFKQINEEELGRRMGQHEATPGTPPPAPEAGPTEDFAAEIEGIWQGVGQSIQNTMSDTYEEILRGGITSFEDLATSVEDIFITMAADIASAMTAKALFGQLEGGTAAMFGTAGGAQGGFMGAPSGASLGGIGMAGGLGAVGGGMVGGLFGSGGSTGGAIGGGLGAAAGMAMFGPLGGLAGGALGSLAGGFIGSMFGGGGGQSNRISPGGALGQAGFGGSGAGAQFIQGIDQSLISLLTARQEVLVSGALAAAKRPSVQYSKTPSAGDLSVLAASRVGPAAQALGLRPELIAGQRNQFTGEQQFANLQTAIGLLKQMESFRIGPVASQFRDLNDQFAELQGEATRLGISTDGLAEAQAKANQQLRRETDRQVFQIAGAVGAMSDLNVQLNLLNVDMQEAGARAKELGVPLSAIRQQHIRLAEALIRQNRAQEIAISAAVGNITQLNAALLNLSLQMQEAYAEATRLGISTAHLAQEHNRLAQSLIRQSRSEYFNVAEQVGAISPLGNALQQLNLEMQEAAARAQELGVPLGNISAEHRRLAAELIKQHQATEAVVRDRRREIAIAVQVGAIAPLNAALQTLKIEMQEAAVEARKLGIPLQNISRQHNLLAQAIVRENRTQVIALQAQIGNITPLQTALLNLNIQMQEAHASARALGVSTANIARQHKLLAEALIRQSRSDFFNTAERVGAISPLQNALQQLNIEMQDAYASARLLGVSTANISKEHLRLVDVLRREHEAAIDAQARSITAPFEQMLDPLREFARGLTLGNLNPADQMKAAGDEFKRIAELARAGSTTAIQQLQGAGEAYISQMERFGASPGGAAARIEVQSVIESVMADISQAQREASAGLEDVISRAAQRQVDTLRELISETRVVAEEIKRLRR